MECSEPLVYAGAPIAEYIGQLQAFDPRVRQSALAWLVDCGSAAVPALCRALETDPDVARVAVCEVFRQVRAPQAVAALCEAVTEGSPEVRQAALAALGALEPADVVRPLRQVVRNGGEPAIAAAELLAEFRDYGAFSALLGQLRARRHGTRARIVLALGRLGDPRALYHLCDILTSGHSAERVAAARALGELADPRAIEPLWHASGDYEPRELREARIAAMASFGASGVPALIDLLQVDEDGGAEEALLRIGAPAIAPVISVLQDGTTATCVRAIRILGALKATEAAPALAAALEDSAASVRAEAALALATIASPCGEEALLRILESGAEGVRVRVCAAITLARRGAEHPQLVGTLAQGLELQPPLRCRTAETLQHLAETRPSLSLRSCLGRLRSLSRAWTLLAEEKSVYRQAWQAIETATRHLAKLPLPVESGPAVEAALPRPASAPEPSIGVLPRPVVHSLEPEGEDRR